MKLNIYGVKCVIQTFINHYLQLRHENPIIFLY